MKILTNAQIIRRMRPYQAQLAEILIADVVKGAAPSSVPLAVETYTALLGPGFEFDNGKTGANQWRDDIRRAAIWTLIKNGFRRGKAVRLTGGDQFLLEWLTVDKETLQIAAQIEIQFGGNAALSKRWGKITEKTERYNTGTKAVYVYTDSFLDELGTDCTKIGRHHFSEDGPIMGRIISQYGTSNPGIPILRYIFKTNDEYALEKALHHRFQAKRIKGGFGQEWFKVSYQDVLKSMGEIVGQLERCDMDQ